MHKLLMRQIIRRASSRTISFKPVIRSVRNSASSGTTLRIGVLPHLRSHRRHLLRPITEEGTPRPPSGPTSTTSGRIFAVIVANDSRQLMRPCQARIPIDAVGSDAARALHAGAQGGAPITLELKSLTEERLTENLPAYPLKGNPGNIVLSGAHLDSVPIPCGNNDNGIAAAAMFETGLQYEPSAHTPVNRLAIGVWSAEEFGMVGAEQFVGQLSGPERTSIRLYLNLEMIGSPNCGLFVPDAGTATLVQARGWGPDWTSASAQRRLADAFRKRGIESQPWRVDGRSGYVPFLRGGIAVGGSFGGSFESKTPPQAAQWGEPPARRSIAAITYRAMTRQNTDRSMPNTTLGSTWRLHHYADTLPGCE